MELIPPLQGLNEAAAYTDQPLLTARTATNVRGLDPVSGRVRLSSREGMTEYAPDAIVGAKVQRLVQSIYDSRRFTYEPRAVEELVWSEDLQGSRLSRAAVVDKQDNLLVVDGDHSIAKYNSDGALVYVLKLPVKDTKHVVRTIDVDDNGNIFAAVSEGGDQDTAEVFRYTPKKTARVPSLEWTYQPGGFVERLRVRGDTLILGVNYRNSGSSEIVQLQAILSKEPQVGWRAPASYPVSDLALKSNGDVIFTSPPNETRGIDPRNPQFTEKTIDWTLKDLENYERRVWCDLDASKIDAADGDDVTFWTDSSGNGRDLFETGDSDDTAPKFRVSAINGLPAVLFRGVDAAIGVNDCLRSGTNSSMDPLDADQQLTVLPGYKGSKWAAFFLFRPTLDPTGLTAKNRCLWSMEQFDDGSGGATVGAEELQMYVNRSADTAAGSGADASAGRLRGAVSLIGSPLSTAYEGASSGTNGTRNMPIQGYFDETHGNDTGTVVVTVVFDSGQSPTIDDGTVPHCTLRVNGKPIDRWVGATAVAPGPFYLGKSFVTADDALRFQGEVGRIIVIREADGELLTMPRYPRTVGTLGGTSAAVAWDPTSETELEKIEGMLMHAGGIAHTAPGGTTTGAPAATVPTLTAYGYAGGYDPGVYPHPYRRWNGPPRSNGDPITVPSQPYKLASPAGIIAKLDGSRGKVQWVATSYADATTGPTNGIGGIGYSVAVSGNRIFAIGPQRAGDTWPAYGYSGSTVHVRCLIDKNTTGEGGYSTLVADGGWTFQFGAFGDEWGYNRLRIDVDPWGNLYVPYYHDFVLGTYADASLMVFTKDGSLGTGVQLLVSSNGGHGYVALVERGVPTYRIGDMAEDDFETSPSTLDGYPRAEYVYLLTDADEEVNKLRLVDVTSSIGTPREIVNVAFGDGDVVRFTSAGYIAPAGIGTLTNPVYDSTAGYVSAVPAFGSVYFTDGIGYYVFNPKTDKTIRWTASDGGKIPPRCRIAELWNGRMVLARSYDDPHNWHMSEQGNPNGWDTFPVPRTSTMAISGNNAQAGRCPDLINAMISASDDLLIFGCDSSMWVMRGDPAAGGVFDRLSNSTGMAFGRGCRDPEGAIYFFGSRGGVYRMTSSDSAPESMTRGVIDRQMRDVDLANYYAELSWDDEHDVLKVLLLPYGTGPARAWAWQRRINGWYVDEYELDGVQPTAMCVFDGDEADDRRVMIGCADGFVRYVDSEARNDGYVDGTPSVIRSSTKWGPLAPKGTRGVWRFTHPTFVLASDQEGAGVRLYAGSDPTSGGSMVWDGTLNAGRNATLPMRARGEYVWIEMWGGHAQRRWSLESASIEAHPAGRSHG